MCRSSIQVVLYLLEFCGTKRWKFTSSSDSDNIDQVLPQCLAALAFVRRCQPRCLLRRSQALFVYSSLSLCSRPLLRDRLPKLFLHFNVSSLRLRPSCHTRAGDGDGERGSPLAAIASLSVALGLTQPLSGVRYRSDYSGPLRVLRCAAPSGA